MSETSPSNSKDNFMSINHDDPKLTAYALASFLKRKRPRWSG